MASQLTEAMIVNLALGIRTSPLPVKPPVPASD